MAGFGTRFREAGYSDYKPFIKIDGLPMVDYVLKAFPTHVHKHIIINPELLSSSERAHLESKEDVTLHEISAHKLGPAYSIYQARHSLPLSEKWFVAYCDIAWTWDFDEVKDLVESGVDGIVFTRQKFHPHLVSNNFSAFCKVSPENRRLIQIKEKGSFTDQWMREPLSVGVFYFKRGSDLIEAIKEQIETNERVAGEYFPSTAFNKLLENPNQVLVTQDVDFFIHWGVPDQLEDYKHWSLIFGSDESLLKAHTSFENVMCMGGTGERMKAYFDQPKALIQFDGTPMYEFVLNRIPAKSHSLITVDTLKEKLQPQIEVLKFSVGTQTKSQIQTLARAKGFLSEKHGFFLSSCDAYGIFDPQDFETFVGRSDPDAVIFTFEPGLLMNQVKKGGAQHHTHVTVDKERVLDVHIKSFSKPSDPGLAGLFWFKNGKDFELLSESTADGREPVVDHFLKDLVKTKKVLSYSLSAYVHLGTPDELSEYFFWKEFVYSLSPKNDQFETLKVGGECDQTLNSHSVL
jgi:NDP-sugar pyrophosphorylase family protein